MVNFAIGHAVLHIAYQARIQSWRQQGVQHGLQPAGLEQQVVVEQRQNFPGCYRSCFIVSLGKALVVRVEQCFDVRVIQGCEPLPRAIA